MRPGILQFGTSRFLQAHVDLFVDDARKAGQKIGPITVVKTTPSPEREDRVRAFGRPEGYPVRIQGLTEAGPVDTEVRIHSIERGLSARDQWSEVVRCFSGEIDRIVTNVGDSGYALPPSIEGDAASLVPASFVGKLMQLLRARHKAHGGKLIILPCELIQGNGAALRRTCREYAAGSGADAAFLAWFEREVIIPNTLVDRIVSEPIEPVGAVAEPYALWAIERCDGLDIGFTHSAIVLADDLAQFERLKLFLLNLPHTLLADRWIREQRQGSETVVQMLGDPAIRRWLLDTVETEVLPGFAEHGMDERARDYWAMSLRRLENPFLRHRISDIAQNHEQKTERRIRPFIAWRRSINAGGAMPRLEAVIGRS